ncbi:MAG: hypothetical protein ACI8W7_002065 [Gammaproteobacteria bacterium]|jgi:hypothetical protein
MWAGSVRRRFISYAQAPVATLDIGAAALAS